MNHQIDTQIANAKLLQLPRYTEAGRRRHAWSSEVAAAYPYASSRQRDCVKVVIHDDFTFCGSPAQFSQVLDNLIKNALHSLTAADSPCARRARCASKSMPVQDAGPNRRGGRRHGH